MNLGHVTTSETQQYMHNGSVAYFFESLADAKKWRADPSIWSTAMHPAAVLNVRGSWSHQSRTDPSHLLELARSGTENPLLAAVVIDYAPEPEEE